MKNKLVILFLVLASSFHTYAEESLTIMSVGQAEQIKDKIYITETLTSSEDSYVKKNLTLISDVIANDFKFYRKYFNVKHLSIKESKKAADLAFSSLSIESKDYKGFILAMRHEPSIKKNVIKVKLMNTNSNKVYFEEKREFNFTNPREAAHLIAIKAFSAITGRKPIFDSKIVFISDLGSTKSKTIKELYLMDFDGANKTRLTRHREIAVSPSISHDGKKIVYSVIKKRRGRNNVDLYLLDIATKQTRPISLKKGINSGAIFTADDKHIIFTMSYQGNAEIYKMNLASKKINRITRNYGNDVDPSITPDGSLMAFLSDRPGKAMIYTLDPSGEEKNVKRIGYIGQFNSSPRFSPNGKEIAFSAWVDNRFDIYRVSSTGDQLVRLTKNFGSNEDPSYSKDSEFIAFSSMRVLSRRNASRNIYIMDKDGEILGSITNSYGRCQSPRWSR